MSSTPQTSFYEITSDSESNPIIFVHGFRGDHHGLLPIAEKISGARILIPDLPAFGASEPLQGSHTLEHYADWLIDFSNREAGESFNLVAHSFGTLVTAKALERGLKPGRVVLINPITQPALKGPQQLATLLARGYYLAGAKLPERFAEKILKNQVIVRIMSEFMAKTRDKSMRKWIHSEHANYFSTFSDPVSLLEAFDASTTSTVLESAKFFSQPTVIIAGELDDITPLSAQLTLKNSIAGAKLHVFKETGHLIHYEEPVKAARLITDFFAE